MAEAKYATYPSLSDRVVVITGGASGIGAATVEAFAQQHARVVFLDLQDEPASQLIERIASAGLTAPKYYRCDLTDIEALQQCVAQIIEKFSTIDVLINNAGNDTRHSIDEVTSEYWDMMIAVNLKQQFFMSQAVIPAMRKARGGVLLNISSISWVIPSVSVPVYVAAKAGIVGMTRTLAHELGKDNIRVNCVTPGAVLTERQKRLWLTEAYKAEILAAQAIKRLIVPEEVARLLLFLASDDSAAITSQSYVIDAGWVSSG